MRVLAFSLCALLCGFGAVRFPTASGSRAAPTRCDSVLAAPSRDSMAFRVSVEALPFDSASGIDAAYLNEVQQGIAQSFVAPSRLDLETYQPTPLVFHPGEYPHLDYAVATVTSYYRVELQRSGHLTQSRAVGGIRSPTLDAAVLRALVTLDTTQLLPPLPDSVTTDSVDLQITVRAAEAADVHEKVDWEKSYFGFSGLFLQATAPPFARSVLEYLLRARFAPMEIGGCPVNALLQEPFEFRQ
jgi:hypothetical protein